MEPLRSLSTVIPFAKKADEAAMDARPVQESKPLEDFIPYYAHYDAHTLLTKNGELIQTIKISANNSGVNYETGEGAGGTVRETIRQAIAGSIKNEHFSVWIHTLRKRKNIAYHAEFKEPFAAYVHEEWQRKHPWKHQYYNEIYVSILYDGQGAELMDKKNLKQLLFPKRNRAFRNAYLDQAYVELDAAVSHLLGHIRQHYNARRLSLVERVSKNKDHRPVFYSEPMELLGTILNLRTREYPVTESDISTVIRPHLLTFGFNAVEAKSTAGKRRFGGMLSLKQYREMPPEVADRILQAPVELIVSQSFSFVPYKQVLKEFKEQKDLFEMSGDTYAMQASGLEEMLAANKKENTDYGEHQTSITVIADEFKILDAEMGKLQSSFGELGLIAIREDIKLEECYWAQLPGNFEFIRRRETISTNKIGGLSRLNRFPGGQAAGNHWGPAVALIPTSVNSPYFFNFHAQDNGHTLLHDFNSFHDSAGRVLLNFLLTHTRKFDGRLFIFDRDDASHLLCDKLGGDYHRFTTTAGKLSLNPFTLDDSPRNRSFLLAWTVSLLASTGAADDAQKATVRAAIDQLYAQPLEQRNLPALVKLIGTQDSELAGALAPWHGKGLYAGLFETQETLDLKRSLHAFDMDPIVKHPDIIIPVFSYLLHRIVMDIDGKPTIIVLHEAWDLLENAFFAPRLESLLEMLKENNVLVIFTTSSPGDQAETHTGATLQKSCATHIYVPDDISITYEARGLGLTPFEGHMLRRMERQKGAFLLKQGNETIGLSAHLDHMDDIHSIFASDVKNLIAAGGPYATLPRTD